jgi:hypothetical protein
MTTLYGAIYTLLKSWCVLHYFYCCLYLPKLFFQNLAKFGLSAEHAKFRNFFSMMYSGAKSDDELHPMALYNFIRDIPFPEEILAREMTDLGPLQWWLPGM